MPDPDDRGFYERVSDIVQRTNADVPRSESDDFPQLHPGKIKRVIVIAVLSLAASTALLYACDYTVIRYRIATNRAPYGSVNVDVYYAIQQKANKTEFTFAGTESQTCLRSLFPHFGYPPCWYARRHTDKQISM
jgi:hypothetical protein